MKANNKTVCTSINKLSNNNKNNETKYLIMSNQGNQNNGSSTHPKYSVGDVLRNLEISQSLNTLSNLIKFMP